MSIPPARAARQRTWLSRNVLLLGLVSLLTDTSSEMILPLLPIFLTTVLGASALAIGWIEGLAELTASLLKLVSGRWSDRMGRKRPLVIAGYGLSSLARPFMGVAGAAWHVLAVRLVDRVGKGVRSSPRDALLAASVAPAERAAAFGLHRAMDHAGAVLGSLLAVAVLLAWSNDLRTLFLLASVPGFLAVAVLIFGVKEESPGGQAGQNQTDQTGQTGEPARKPAPAAQPRAGLLRVLVPVGLFTLGNASDAFLLVKASTAQATPVTLALLWAGLHMVKVLVSVAGGQLADRFGRRRLIGAGWLVYVAVYTGFAFADSQAEILALFLIYGVYHGLTEGAQKALIAELAPGSRWGTAFGWYHLTLGVLTLAASVLFGGLWEVAGSRVAFLTSAGLALLALVCLGALAPQRARAART